MKKQIIISVFGSGTAPKNSLEYAEAYAVGKLLAQNHYIVCNGGYRGIMEASARGASEANGRTVGVIAKEISQVPNRWIGRTYLVSTHHQRLMMLLRKGDGYLVLKGGTGTLVELATAWELMRKGLMKSKPIILVSDFWAPVIRLLDSELLEDKLRDRLTSLEVVQTAEAAVQRLNDYFVK